MKKNQAQARFAPMKKPGRGPVFRGRETDQPRSPRAARVPRVLRFEPLVE
jgi:hypothetical protein